MLLLLPANQITASIFPSLMIFKWKLIIVIKDKFI